MKADALVMSNSGEQNPGVSRGDILRMMKARDDIDEQIQALGGILESNHVGMTEALVDSEGFPRNDIDVYQVRHARHQIICLQNDRKALTKRIESGLEKYHDALRQGADGSPMDVDSISGSDNPGLQPIAKVNQVTSGSPAFHAGLKVDDLVISVGSLDSTNYTGLAQIGSFIQRSAGTVVSVKVRRDNQIVKLALIPGPWSGRGLLGCNILPFENVER